MAYDIRRYPKYLSQIVHLKLTLTSVSSVEMGVSRVLDAELHRDTQYALAKPPSPQVIHPLADDIGDTLVAPASVPDGVRPSLPLKARSRQRREKDV